MSHRGGCGCDPNSGDGAGVLVGMPDAFMRTVALESFGKVRWGLGRGDERVL